jgi:hypothetical protein
MRVLCDGREGPNLASGGQVEVLLDYKVAEPVRSARVRVGFNNLLGDPVFACCNDYTGKAIPELPGPEGTIRVAVPRLPLNQGSYKVNAWIKSGRDLEDWIQDGLEVAVTGGDFFGSGAAVPADAGPALVPHSVEVLPVKARRLA